MRTVFLAIAVTMMATSPIASRDVEPQIVGHIYSCTIERNLEHGNFTADRTLREDGKALDRPDGAQWHPHKYGIPQPGYAARWHSFGGGARGYHQLEEIDGHIQIFFSHTRSLPKKALWKFKRPGSRFESALSTITSTNAEPKLSGTQFSLSDIMNFAAQSPSLTWSMERLSPRANGQNVYHSGTFDMAGLNEAQQAYREASQQLNSMQADYKNACKKTPVYYDEHSEISIT